MRLTTPRLIIDEIDPADLDALLDVYISNPAFLERTEGTAGEVGLYERSKLERDLAVSELDPLRHTLTVCTKSQGVPVGAVDFVRAHGEDRRPWVGLVIVHADQQRQGYGREVVEAVSSWAANGLRADKISATADEDDERARAFLDALGFFEIGRRWRHGPSGDVVNIIYERTLSGS